MPLQPVTHHFCHKKLVIPHQRQSTAGPATEVTCSLPVHSTPRGRALGKTSAETEAHWILLVTGVLHHAGSLECPPSNTGMESLRAQNGQHWTWAQGYKWAGPVPARSWENREHGHGEARPSMDGNCHTQPSLLGEGSQETLDSYPRHSFLFQERSLPKQLYGGKQRQEK
jgi:hypothetical protein